MHNQLLVVVWLQNKATASFEEEVECIDEMASTDILFL